MNEKQRDELLLQMLETELGGVQVYTEAVKAAVNKDLKKEWTKYLAQTKEHVKIVTSLFKKVGLDPKKQSPGRKVVHHIGASLVAAIKLARSKAPKAAAEIVAAEVVTLAETKDHLNWELFGECVKAMKDGNTAFFRAALEKVEDQEDEHLYHTTGWTRELWIQALGMPASLPPPEEKKKVKTAEGAASAKKHRKSMVRAKKK